MKRAAFILFAVAVAVVTLAPSEARRYHHRWCDFSSYHDGASNYLSPLTYVFPAADWGPFFRCRMYQSPVVTVLPNQY